MSTKSPRASPFELSGAGSKRRPLKPSSSTARGGVRSSSGGSGSGIAGLGAKLGAPRRSSESPGLEPLADEYDDDAAAPLSAAAAAARAPRSKRSFDLPSASSSASSIGSSDMRKSQSQGKARKLLMPTIPTRRASSNEANGSDGSSSPVEKKTNIQSIASAIAARAQLVAAENAAKRAEAERLAAQAASPEAAQAPEASNAAVVRISSPDTGAAAQNDVTSTPRAAAVPLQEASAASSTLSPPSPTQQKRDSYMSRDSMRWSRGEWADFRHLASHVDFGDSLPEDVGESRPAADVPVESKSERSGSSAQSHASPASTPKLVFHDSESHEASQRSKEQLGSPIATSSLAGLGIGGASNILPAQSKVASGMSNSASLASVSSFTTAHEDAPGPSSRAGLASPGAPHTPTLTNEITAKLASPIGSIGKKSKPAALALDASPASVSYANSPGISRGLPSPIARGKTPPPTNPPMEPLPPLPTTPSGVSSARLSKGSMASQSRSNSLHRLRLSSDASDPTHGGKRSSGESNTSAHAGLRSPPTLSSSNGHSPSESTAPASSSSAALSRATGSMKAKASTATASFVAAHHLQTHAGAEHAEALLKRIEPEMTYNDRRASLRAAAKQQQQQQKEQQAAQQAPPSQEIMLEEQRKEDEKRISAGSAYSVESAASASNAPDAEELGDVREEAEDEEEPAVLKTATRLDPAAALASAHAPASGAASTSPQRVSAVRVDSAPVLLKGAQVVAGRNPSPARPTATAQAGKAEAAAPAAADAKPDAAADAEETFATPGTTPTPGQEPRSATTDGHGAAADAASTDPSSSAKPAAAAAGSSASPTASDAPAGSALPASSSKGDSSLSHAPSSTWTPSSEVSEARLSYISGDERQPSVQSRRGEMEAERGTSKPGSLERIKRAEGRFSGAFGEIATAFKQLQAEKRALEVIVRETTPLAGINDGEGLGRYLSTMSQKLELSSAEIRKLLDLLDQQRTVMDYMLDTHQLELDTADDDNDDLRDALAVALEHAETHEITARRLAEELEQANAAAETARADARKVRTRLADEENQRERAVTLLRSARDELQKADRERKEAQQRHLNSEQEASHARSMLSSLQEQLTLATNRLDSDDVQRNLSNVGLRDELESEHAQHIKELTEEHEAQYSELQERLAAAEKELDKARVAGFSEDAKHEDPRDEQIKAQALQLERVYDEMADAMSDNVLARKRIAELEDQLRGRGDIGLLKRQFLEAQQRHEQRSNELHRQLKEAQKAHETTRSDMQKTLQLTSFVNGANGETAKELVIARRQHDEARAAQKQAEQDLQKALADLVALKEANASKASPRLSGEKDARNAKTASTHSDDGLAQRLSETERERDDMLRRVQQQEKDIAELRAAIALSAHSPSELKAGVDPLQRSATNVGRETQVSALMTQLAEQRARETQIRSAYKQARDELRKMQSAQSSERKRHNASLNYLAGGGGLASSMSMNSLDSAASGGTASYAPSSRSATATINGSGKKLKRLSLPLATHPASPGFTADGFVLRPDTASGAIGSGRFARAPSTELGHGGVGQDSPKSMASGDGRGESWGSSSSAVAEQDHEAQEELSH